MTSCPRWPGAGEWEDESQDVRMPHPRYSQQPRSCFSEVIKHGQSGITRCLLKTENGKQIIIQKELPRSSIIRKNVVFSLN